MDKNSLRRLSIDVEFWCDTVGYEWSKTAKYPYFFMVLDPIKKSFSIKRWGFTKRPFGSESILWQKIRIGHSTTYAREIFATLLRWSEHWDNVFYNNFENEFPPKAYINSIRSNKETLYNRGNDKLWVINH